MRTDAYSSALCFSEAHSASRQTVCDEERPEEMKSKRNKARFWCSGLVFRLSLGFCVLGFGQGCKKFSTERVEIGSYGGTQTDLIRLWQELLVSATRDDRDRVIAVMQSFRMSRDELALLIGDEKAQRFWPRYELLSRPLLGPLAAELVAKIYEHHYDDVEVIRVDEMADDQLSDAEKAVRRALVQPTPIYRVRVIRKGQPWAIRYEFFVYVRGFWRTGRDLGKFLDPLGPISPTSPLPPNGSPGQPESAVSANPTKPG